LEIEREWEENSRGFSQSDGRGARGGPKPRRKKKEEKSLCQAEGRRNKLAAEIRVGLVSGKRGGKTRRVAEAEVKKKS